MKVKTIAAAMLIALGANVAQATTMALGDLGTTPITGTMNVSPGSFTDYLNFNVVSPLNVIGGNVSNIPIGFGVYNFYNIAGLTVTLFDGLGGTGSSLGSLTGTNAYQMTGYLASGDYSLQVTGTGVGAAGGMYSYAAVAAAVPEPESYAMFLAGLGLIGFMVSRRRIG